MACSCSSCCAAMTARGACAVTPLAQWQYPRCHIAVNTTFMEGAAGLWQSHTPARDWRAPMTAKIPGAVRRGGEEGRTHPFIECPSALKSKQSFQHAVVRPHSRRGAARVWSVVLWLHIVAMVPTPHPVVNCQTRHIPLVISGAINLVQHRLVAPRARLADTIVYRAARPTPAEGQSGSHADLH